MKRSQGGSRLAATAAVLAALTAPAAWADATSGVLSVNITLNGALQDVCVSETLSAQTHAIVQVVCSSGQFVRIDPDPAKPFLGVHGGAFRHHFGLLFEAGAPARLCCEDLWFGGTGTVTSLRIYNPGGAAPLELLVSF